ncbi:MAG: hypothetical protein NTX97_02470 [Bacteroidetes bacterium]|nr:hypothetical protein [Bacteroidota bacterium]
MKKDITPPLVENIAVAVVKELNELNETEWNVYLLNLKNEKIEGVLVSSHGYGNINGEDVKTSTLRHFLDDVPTKSFVKFEPIMETLFALNNEYWVSFFLNNVMYDKKYIFLPETIKEENFILIPYINKKGVMIK